MKITVNKDICIGCGLCTLTAPEIFEMDSDGKSKVKSQSDDRELINRVISDCPVQAVSVED